MNTAVSCAPEIAYLRSKTKNGTPVAPNAAGQRDVGLHLRGEGVAVQHCGGFGPVQPDLDGQREQLVTVADPHAFG